MATPVGTWWPSIVEPGWTILIRDIRDQQSKLGREKSLWARAMPSESGTRGPQSSAPSGNEFLLAEHRLIPGSLRTETRANGTMWGPQEEYESNRKEEPTQPSLHGDSASRARRRFPSLFISGSAALRFFLRSCQRAIENRFLVITDQPTYLLKPGSPL